MAEETLVGEHLDDRMIAAGRKVQDVLRRHNYSAELLMWILLPHEQQWRLLLVNDTLSKMGPSEAYGQLLNWIRSDTPGAWKQPWWVSRLTLLGSQDSLVGVIKAAIGGEEDYARGRLINLGIHTSSVAEAYLY